MTYASETRSDTATRQGLLAATDIRVLRRLRGNRLRDRKNNSINFQVLTANIGTLLDLYGVERGLEHFRSTSVLNFNQFKYYLQQEVFSSLPKTLQHHELRLFESKIAEVCWLICRTRYLPRDNRIFSDDSMFQIFRIFCVLAELVPDQYNENVYQVLLHPSEVCNIAQSIASSLGCYFDEEDFTSLSISMGNFRFAPFIAVLESRCLNEISDTVALEESVNNIYQKIVEDVIKKGFLTKKGYIFPTMREYWFVLRPSELTYYTGRNEKDRRGSLTLEPRCKVEPKAGYKILLHSSERTYELGTTDHMSRLQWISALQLASEHSGKHVFNYYHLLQMFVLDKICFSPRVMIFEVIIIII
uniref:Switch-associated protein 70-like n=1 Tax=Diabrotica virgifera virgifera TaxID=50390 RepID=A0A6P7G0Y8_DIAVI